MKIAKRLIQEKDSRIWEALKYVLEGFPIFLNRAPTLHRLGIQAFEPIIVDGRAIRLHPLVCPAFNADFDGDQMAIHIPLSIDAQAESYLLMLGPNNFMSPATGEPILLPSQDMVLGSHYLTSQSRSQLKENYQYFGDLETVLQSYYNEKIALHSSIWLRFNGEIQISDPPILLDSYIQLDGSVIYVYNDRQIRKKNGETLVVYILTTPGRVLFNNLIHSVLA
jgi:DNA-directed RNA polymerase subunit beta'